MAWYNPFEKKTIDAEEKLNPAQSYYERQIEPSREYTYQYEKAYEDLEIVNRGVNMIVDDVSEIPTTVVGQLNSSGVIKGIKRSRVDMLLNKEPNPFQDINTFRRNLITDYLIDGNIFILMVLTCITCLLIKW
jgi:phage portal protein BeeE